MKRSILVLLVLCFVSTQVFASEHYSVKIKATLYYSNSSSTKKMGSVDGTLTARDDGKFSTLVLGGEKVPFQLERFSIWRYQACMFCDFEGPKRPELAFTLDRYAVWDIMLMANNLWWRKNSTKRHVVKVIEKVMMEAEKETYSIQAWYRSFYEYPNIDNTVTRLDFLPFLGKESVFLVIDVANKVRTI